MSFKEKLYKATHDLADRRFSDWTPPVNGLSTYRKPVRIKTIEDVAAIAQLLSPEGEETEIWIGRQQVTEEEIATMSPARLSSIDISAYPPSAQPGPRNCSARLTINPHQVRAWIDSYHLGHKQRGTGSFMTLEVPARDHYTTETVTLAKAQDLAKRCTEVVPRRERKKPYAVVNRITVETEDQRNHDRKIRWQTALISIGISVGVAVLSFLLNLSLPG